MGGPRNVRNEAALDRELATGVSREAPKRRTMPADRVMRERRTVAVVTALHRCAQQHNGFPPVRLMAEAAVQAYEGEATT